MDNDQKRLIHSVADVVAAARLIQQETMRAIELHPPLHSYHEAYGVIVEELQEFWTEAKVNPKKLSRQKREDRLYKIREELIQLAAMCIRTIVEVEDPVGYRHQHGNRLRNW